MESFKEQALLCVIATLLLATPMSLVQEGFTASYDPVWTGNTITTLAALSLYSLFACILICVSDMMLACYCAVEDAYHVKLNCILASVLFYLVSQVVLLFVIFNDQNSPLLIPAGAKIKEMERKDRFYCVAIPLFLLLAWMLYVLSAKVSVAWKSMYPEPAKVASTRPPAVSVVTRR